MAKKQNILNNYTFEHLKKLQMFWYVLGFCKEMDTKDLENSELRRGITLGIQSFNQTVKNVVTPKEFECQRQTFYKMQAEYLNFIYTTHE